MECAKDLGFALSCRGPHEQRAAEVEALISRNASVQRVAGGGAKYAAPLFYLFMGAVFAIYGQFFARSGSFLVILGGGFVVFGAYIFVVNRRAFSNAAIAPDRSAERSREE